jgi:hypothetical protein
MPAKFSGSGGAVKWANDRNSSSNPAGEMISRTFCPLQDQCDWQNQEACFQADGTDPVGPGFRVWLIIAANHHRERI